MSFASFITDVYARVANKNTATLALLRQITVEELRLTPQRVLIAQGDTTFTIPSIAPYHGQWAGPEVAGFPPDVAEVHQALYRVGSDDEPTRWQPFDGPVPLADIQGMDTDRLLPTPLQVYPLAWSWWDGKLYVTRLGGDVVIRLLYLRDATRDALTGVKISTSSTDETNAWFDEGAEYLRWAVLLKYYSQPQFVNQEMMGICGAQKNLAGMALEKEMALQMPASIQAPAYMGGEALYGRQTWR